MQILLARHCSLEIRLNCVSYQDEGRTSIRKPLIYCSVNPSTYCQVIFVVKGTDRPTTANDFYFAVANQRLSFANASGTHKHAGVVALQLLRVRMIHTEYFLPNGNATFVGLFRLLVLLFGMVDSR